MLIRRGVAAALLVALIVGAAAVLGSPDAGRALSFLTGSSLASGSMFALMATLCWTAIVLVVMAVVVNAVRPLPRPLKHATPMTRALLIAVAGMIALGIGVVRHQAGYQVCCASVTSTQRAEQLVH